MPASLLWLSPFGLFCFPLYSSFCVLCHLLYACFFSCTTHCTASFHHNVSNCILRSPMVTPYTSFAASKTFYSVVLSCFHPSVFILFFCCTFTSNCLHISSSFSFHSLYSFMFFLGSSNLDLLSVGGVELNTPLLG